MDMKKKRRKQRRNQRNLSKNDYSKINNRSNMNQYPLNFGLRYVDLNFPECLPKFIKLLAFLVYISSSCLLTRSQAYSCFSCSLLRSPSKYSWLSFLQEWELEVGCWLILSIQVGLFWPPYSVQLQGWGIWQLQLRDSSIFMFSPSIFSMYSLTSLILLRKRSFISLVPLPLLTLQVDQSVYCSEAIQS